MLVAGQTVFVLSTFQVSALVLLVVAAIALSYFLGLGEGSERARRQLRDQARQNRAAALKRDFEAAARDFGSAGQ